MWTPGVGKGPRGGMIWASTVVSAAGRRPEQEEG